MVFNSRQPKTVEIDGVSFSIRPLTASQQAEIMDRIEAIKSNVDLIACGHLTMNFSIVDISGLKDENGNDVKPVRDEMGNLHKDFLEGFGVAEIRPILNAILKSGKIGEDVKKN